MILKDILYNGILWFSITLGILLTIIIECKSFRKEAYKDLKSIASNLGVCAILSAICAFILYWVLDFFIGMIVSNGAIEIKEIVYENDTYNIVVKYYFDKSKIPTGNDYKVLYDTKGTHYYNGTDKEIVYFSKNYFSESILKSQQNNKKMQEKEKPLDLIHMNNSHIEYDTVSGVIIKPLSFFNMTRNVDCAFEPSPTSIVVRRSKKSQYAPNVVDSITIMDVKDSLINHHWVVIRNPK